jgi:hypothetical protein
MCLLMVFKIRVLSVPIRGEFVKTPPRGIAGKLHSFHEPRRDDAT